MSNAVLGQQESEWLSAYRVETARVSICPCDALSSFELSRILADPRVSEAYCVGRSTMEESGYWTQQMDDWKRLSCMNLAVREQINAEVIGLVQFDSDHLNYFLNPCYWRQGYGAEIVGACCRIFPRLLELEIVRATVIRENIGSRRILEKTGFVFDGLSVRRWHGRAGSVAMLQYKLYIPQAH